LGTATYTPFFAQAKIIVELDINSVYTPAMPQQRQRKSQPARAVSRNSCKPVLVYFPEAVVRAVNLAVVAEDTDRSKWIRKAIREALDRRGVASAS